MEALLPSDVPPILDRDIYADPSSEARTNEHAD
jgi:hypothetical protein